MKKNIHTSSYDEGWHRPDAFYSDGGMIMEKSEESITPKIRQDIENKIAKLLKDYGIYYYQNIDDLISGIRVGSIDIEHFNGVIPWLNINGVALKKTMPSELINELIEYQYRYGDFTGSPYNYKYDNGGSFYFNCPKKSWDFTANGCIRISDHWNFYSRGEYHARTKDRNFSDPFNEYWSIGVYDSNLEAYEIIDQFEKVKSNKIFEDYTELIIDNDPRLNELKEQRLRQKEQDEAIKFINLIEQISNELKTKALDAKARKEGYKSYEHKVKKLAKEKKENALNFAKNGHITATVTKRTYYKRKGRWVLDSEIEYSGNVIGKSKTMITIATKNGEIITGKDYKINAEDLPDGITWEDIPNYEHGGKLHEEKEYKLPEILKKVIPLHQQNYLKEINYSEHIETLQKLEDAANQLKSRNDNGEDTVMYLHYFYGNADWYISEWQKSDDIFFGFANLGDDINAEWGSVFRKELVEHGRIELDFYFKPKPIKEIKVGGNDYYEKWMQKKLWDEQNRKQPSNPDTKQSLQTTTTVSPEQIAATNAENQLNNVNLQNVDINIKPYQPESDACFKLKTNVPASMWFEIQKALASIDRKVRGVDQYVAEKLGYIKENCSNEEWKAGMQCLCNALAAEQVDAVAMAIYNIEEKKQGLICGDMTGIGKGRVAAAIMRYAVINNIIPLFFTEKANLFSDIYRDIIDIGSDDGIPLFHLEPNKQEQQKKVRRNEIIERIKEDIEDGDYEGSYDSDTLFDEGNEDKLNSVIEEYRELYFPSRINLVDKYTRNASYETDIIGKQRMVPFIVNGSSEKSNIKDKNGNIIYKGLPAKENSSVLDSKELPPECKVILCTYSQIASWRAKKKRDFISYFADNSVIVMDESHNASGDSATGGYLRGLLKECKGVIYLSATYAKRPDNMPIYAIKTAISDVALNDEQLIDGIKKGGTALQEIISSQLAGEGQLIRRERSFADTEIIYMQLDESQEDINPKYNLKTQHRALFDQATEILREMISFQSTHIRSAVQKMNKDIRAEQKVIGIRQGTQSAGIHMPPEFSGIFQIINQLLFSIKANAVAEIAIDEIKRGRKPLIAFSSTMESFLDSLQNDDGTMVNEGDIISTDFTSVFMRRFNALLKISVTDSEGNSEKNTIPLHSLSMTAQTEYERIRNKIKNTVSGIHISPIDVIIDAIKKAGYSVGEVTGRQRALNLIDNYQASIVNRVRIPTQDIIRKFQNNEIDCLLLNQSGSTGVSAHAVPTEKIKKDQVKPRTMIVLQFELNINTEIQKRGRIFRTGQIYPPKYIYVTSAIPAEQRMNLMLQRKLKSLDANTTSNQKQNEEVAGGKDIDFLNKYGDKLVYDYLLMDKAFNLLINDPLEIEASRQNNTEIKIKPDAAYKVAGSIAILPISMQENFYQTMSENYQALVESLKETDEYDLEVESLDLKAETLGKQIAVMGMGGKSVFGRHTILEECEINAIKKPFTVDELKAILKNTLTDENGGELTPEQYINNIKEEAKNYYENRVKEEQNHAFTHHDNIRKKINQEDGYIKATNKLEYENTRNKEIEEELVAANKKIEREWDGKFSFIRSAFNSFKPGDVIAYPSLTYLYNGQWQRALFLGWEINRRSRNPFAPGIVKMRLAFPSNKKYVTIPLSKTDIFMTCKALTDEHITEYDSSDMMASWNELIKESQKDRVIRYIVTGNIIQAFKMETLRGRLISYTLANGMEKKGLLLPETFNPSADFERGNGFKVSVPIIKAAPIIKSIAVGKGIQTDNGISIIRYNDDDYTMLVPASRKTGGQYYLDPDILELEYSHNFNKVADKMKGLFGYNKLDKLLAVLQYKFQTSVSLSPAMFEIIADTVEIEEYPDEAKYVPKPTSETITINHPVIAHFEKQDLQLTTEADQDAQKEARLLKTKYQLMKLIMQL